MLVFPVTHHGYILVLPVVIAAWMFGKRGLLITFSMGLFILLVYHTVRLGSVWWPPPFTLSFLSGVLILLSIGFIVVSLRNFVDAADTARQQAQQAEQQLTFAYEQQRQLNQLKTQFILNVNHELRTPLTVVFGYLSVLQQVLDRDGHLDRATYGSYLERAINQCQALQSLVNSVLDTKSFANRGELFAFEEVTVAATVRDVLEQFGSMERRAHRIQLDVPEHLTVWADAKSIHQVLHNLLSNAFKYSPAHTLVVVSAVSGATAAQEKSHAADVCISVKDSGPGIPPDEIPLLFGQFVRLKRDLVGPVRGTGLGLYISKNIVEAMGGRMWVESAGIPGQGSRFCFTLPRTPNQIIASAVGKQVPAITRETIDTR